MQEYLPMAIQLARRIVQLRRHKYTLAEQIESTWRCDGGTCIFLNYYFACIKTSCKKLAVACNTECYLNEISHIRWFDCNSVQLKALDVLRLRSGLKWFRYSINLTPNFSSCSVLSSMRQRTAASKLPGLMDYLWFFSWHHYRPQHKRLLCHNNTTAGTSDVSLSIKLSSQEYVIQSMRRNFNAFTFAAIFAFSQ